MNASTIQTPWLESFKQSLARYPNDSFDEFSQLREHAIRALDTEPTPFRKMERWRYTPVDSLFKLPLNVVKSDPANDADFSQLFNLNIDSYRLVVANGKATFLGDATGLPEGVIITTMERGRQENKVLLSQYAGVIMQHKGTENTLQASLGQKDSKLFQYLNQSVMPDGIFIHLSEGVKLTKPVEIMFVKTGDQANLIQAHNVIVLEKDAEMTLIEKHVDENSSSSFCNNQIEICLQEKSKLKHYYLQNQNSNNWHRQAIHRIQSSESHYQGWLGCCGSQWSRLEMNVIFTGENAVSNVNGIQLAMNGQVNDIHLDTRHDQPSCHSEQHFRGLVTGNSKIVFDGNITVSQDAQKTVAHLSDNNLMLSRNAEIDAKPQLEIYADDVQCSHGTSIGEIDEQQVFYLRSRGISSEQARRLLSLGFVAELIDEIELEEFRLQMLDLLDHQLQGLRVQEAKSGAN